MSQPLQPPPPPGKAAKIKRFAKNNNNNNFMATAVAVIHQFTSNESIISKKKSKDKKMKNIQKQGSSRETCSLDTKKNKMNSKNIDNNWKRNCYLFLYNIFMLIMFLRVNAVLILKISNGTIGDDIVKGATFIVRILTITQLIMETLHPMLGLVPGGALMPFTQATGRLIVNQFLTDDDIRVDAYPYVHYLFLVWISVELFRYSYYALNVLNFSFYPLTWCRYSLFLPLYPCGGFCETMVILSTIKIYEKTGAFSVSLPNAANISFNLPILLKLYLIFILWPTIYSLMKYMLKQRSKQLKEKIA